MPGPRLPYVRYSVPPPPPPRPSFHHGAPVSMYAHPTSPPLLTSPTSPSAWQQTYLPQKLPSVMNQPPMHVSHALSWLPFCVFVHFRDVAGGIVFYACLSCTFACVCVRDILRHCFLLSSVLSCCAKCSVVIDGPSVYLSHMIIYIEPSVCLFVCLSITSWYCIKTTVSGVKASFHLSYDVF